MWMEEKEKAEEDAGQSGVLPPRGCGSGAPALLAGSPRICRRLWGSGHLGQQLGVVAGRRWAPGASPARDRSPHASAGRLFCPPRRGSTLTALPPVPAETATQAGPGQEGRRGGTARSQVRARQPAEAVRAQLLFTTR